MRFCAFKPYLLCSAAIVPEYAIHQTNGHATSEVVSTKVDADAIIRHIFWAIDGGIFHWICIEWQIFHKFACLKSSQTLIQYNQGVSEGYCAMSYIISNPHSRTIWSSKGFRIHPHTAEKTTRFLFRGTFGHTVYLTTTKFNYPTYSTDILIIRIRGGSHFPFVLVNCINPWVTVSEVLGFLLSFYDKLRRNLLTVIPSKSSHKQ